MSNIDLEESLYRKENWAIIPNIHPKSYNYKSLMVHVCSSYPEYKGKFPKNFSPKAKIILIRDTTGWNGERNSINEPCEHCLQKPPPKLGSYWMIHNWGKY